MGGRSGALWRLGVGIRCLTAMITWSDDAIVLDCRKHGESSAILSLLTLEHGRHHGLLRNAAGRKDRGVAQPGNRVRATWQARLPEHLGTFRCELLDARAVVALGDPMMLAGLSAARALCLTALPERMACPLVYREFDQLIGLLGGDGWAVAYLRWELTVLAEMGYGLDLGQCAATGQLDDLAYVSPRTGRAVSREAGAPYRERLLKLPTFLYQEGGLDARPDVAEIKDGFALTGHFLQQFLYSPLDRRVPEARNRFVKTVTGG